MKVFRKLAFASLLFSPIASANFFAADGFITVGTNKVSDAEKVFKYCDKPSPNKIECFDSLFDGNGLVESKKVKSEWRVAEDYVKYKLGNDFDYVGMSFIGHSIVLYYKKHEETVAKR